MICHQCNQDSIKIYNDSDIEESPIYLKCDICGAYISCGFDSLLCDLFIYNENLKEAEQLGREALNEGMDIGDNPYSIDSNQILLHNRWELGYKAEQISYEYSALSFSAKKVEEDLREQIIDKDRQIKKLCEKITEQYVKIDNYIQKSNDKRDSFYYKLLGIKILGRFLKKYINTFEEEYYKIMQDLWNSR